LAGNGRLDLAVVSTPSNQVAILIGNGDGTFQPAAAYTVGVIPTGVAMGDFNGDGRLDLAVTNTNGDSVSVLLGKGDGTLEPDLYFGAAESPGALVVQDFNGDGKPDVATANISNSISVLTNRTQ
jgi:hypothetical protein